MSSCRWPRSGRTRRIFPALCALSLLAGAGAWAQVPSAPQTPLEGLTAPLITEGQVLQVDSTPSGAVVVLHGPYEWVGQTPWRLDREVSGLYQVEASLPGYETWRGKVVLGAGGTRQLSINLSRKTRVKALVRSLVLPGWGQLYRGSNVKGDLLIGAMVLSAAGVVWTDIAYEKRLDDFHAAKTSFESAHALGENWDRLESEVKRTSRRAGHSYDARRICLGAAAGVYVLAALDAFLVSPGGDRNGAQAALDPSVPAGSPPGAPLGWNALIGAESVQVGLTFRWN